MENRETFLKSATQMGAGGAMASMAMAASTGGRAKVAGGVRVGNLYFSSGLTGVCPEARKDPLAFGGDIEVDAKYFPKDPPSRSAFGVDFPDTATRVGN
jgi:hypothetical protein